MLMHVNGVLLSLAHHSYIGGPPTIPTHWALCALLRLRGNRTDHAVERGSNACMVRGLRSWRTLKHGQQA